MPETYMCGATRGFPTFSPSFIPGILSVSFACPGWSGAPDSVSSPRMPFLIQFMGQEVLEISEVCFGGGGGVEEIETWSGPSSPLG